MTAIRETRNRFVTALSWRDHQILVVV